MVSKPLNNITQGSIVDGVDFGFEERHHCPLDVGGVHSQLLERALDAAGSLAGIGEVAAFYGECVMHG